MKKKKIISLATASVLSVNMMPLNLITSSSTEAPKEAGAYVATEYLSSESNYRSDIAVRRFTISKSASTYRININ